uniref:exodeoxyribonuclease III n=1 Tax=Salvator merianae TaxID=96440 RepID=A0A8D0BJ26_SALMN
MSNLKILSLNVKGTNNVVKRKRIERFFVKEQGHILFVQETHQAKKTLKIFSYSLFKHEYSASGTSKSRGVAIIIHPALPLQVQDIKRDVNGRYIFLNCILNTIKITLASLYAPNLNQSQFLANTLAELQMFAVGEIIIGGDLNTTLDNHLDRKTFQQCKKPARVTFLPKLLTKYDLADSFRLINQTSKEYTFYSHSQKTYSRLDYILISTSLIHNLLDASISAITLSDHAPVM